MNVFTPIKIGSVELKNRIIFSSMCVHFCDSEGNINDVLTEYVRERAEGGVGLIIMPGSPHGKPSVGRPAISDNSYIPGWRKLADMVHSNGAKLFCQLHPAAFQAGRGYKIDDMNDFTTEYIHELINSYADGAVRCKIAGVDGVEIHGAHAHEVAQFMSPFYNRRTDEYGGSTENRARFAVEIVRGIKAKTGADFPLIFRISGDEHVEGGRRIEETVEIAKMLEAAGADAIHVSCGMPESEYMISAPMDVEDAFNADNAAKVKAAVSIPVVAVNRITNIDEANEVLASGKADLVAMARANLADPYMIAKTLNPALGPIRPCVGCNQGCRDAIKYKKIRCMQNPRLGFESVLNFVPASEEEKKQKIMIVGAGPGGLEVAYDLGLRGFKPDLYEKSGRPGGLVNFAAMPPRKGRLMEIINFRVKALEWLGIPIHYNTEVDLDFIKREKPDVLIIATGSKAFLPPIPGIHSDNVFTGDEVLSGEKKLAGRHIAVLGGGLVGCETADYLASQGYDIEIIEMNDAIGEALNLSRKHFMFKSLSEQGVKAHIKTRVQQIALPVIKVNSNGYDYEIRDVDGVVVAAGRKPVETLSAGVREALPSCRIFLVGDANEGGFAIDAIQNAARVAAKV